ncbi:MAG: ImmA/IrrE family metallo-endopeptidase [Paracoccaceae bacterium]|nr:ImmA/IrrE family metallo-endopeptidase [Candidatus Poribacteria bacterium]MDE2916226.1 ImmA/IrrE family metallo-endopeptidase [Paracoccaceae bacterium]
MNDSEIRAKAQELIQRFGIKELPVDPFSIASNLNISIRPKPCNQEGGIAGALLRSGNDFGILYATNIPNIGYQKFTVAHEIGHFVLDGHMAHLRLSDGDIHYSTPGFHGDKYEREANYFAACLLMPDPLFIQAMSAYDDGMESIKNLAEDCETSLTATAIRYIEETESMSALVVSEKDRILYSLFPKKCLN